MPRDVSAKFRADWFKLIACDSHTWPVSHCDECWEKIIARLESECMLAQRNAVEERKS